jgi:hypothetical protein
VPSIYIAHQDRQEGVWMARKPKLGVNAGPMARTLEELLGYITRMEPEGFELRVCVEGKGGVN